MLDFLLRHVSGRNLVIAVMAALSLPFLAKIGKNLRATYMRAVYPPVRDAGASAADIKGLLDQREQEKVQAQYRRVTALIGDARMMGYDVKALALKAQSAMAYNVPGKRAAAMQMLTEVEMDAPRRRVQYIPMYAPAPRDTMTDEDETPATPASVTRAPAKTSAKISPNKKKRTRKAKAPA